MEWLQSPELRRRVQVGLNKGKAKNASARGVFFNRLDELRDRTFEDQRDRASGLNLIIAAISSRLVFLASTSLLSAYNFPIPSEAGRPGQPRGFGSQGCRFDLYTVHAS